MNLASLNLPPAPDAARLRQLRRDQRAVAHELDELVLAQQALPLATPRAERQRLLLREQQLSEQLRNVCGSLHQLTRAAYRPPFALAG